MTPPDTQLTVACIQMEPRIGAVEENVRRSLEFIGIAADRGARLIVLPELCNSGYVFETAEEARDLAEDATSGPSVQAWAEIAARRDLHIVAGLCERAGDGLFNGAVLIGPQGPLGTYRKMHLWDQENRFFTPGDLGFPIFDLPFGRVGVLICYDGWFPESWRMCGLQDADIVCVPTNWVPMPAQPAQRDAMANILVMAAAHSNSVFIAAADRIGTERGQPFLGRSLIVAPTGWPLAGPASADQEEILLASFDPTEARRTRQLNAFNHVLNDRRPEFYQARQGEGLRPSTPARAMPLQPVT
ncbi:MAG: nitrilase family protein [Acidisphaera sp.]|nr:nitrilase family protein [Acidisphaera sp.]